MLILLVNQPVGGGGSSPTHSGDGRALLGWAYKNRQSPSALLVPSAIEGDHSALWQDWFALSRTTGAGYSLAAGAGAFALTGAQTALGYGRRFPASVGALSLGGPGVGLKRGFAVSATTGAFVIAGQSAQVRMGRRLSAVAGNLALSGDAIGFRRGLRLPCSEGSFTAVGQVSSLRYGRRFAALVGSFSLAGNAANIGGALSLSAAVGVFATTGQAASFQRGIRVAGALGAAFGLVGHQINLKSGKRLAASAGTFSLSGLPAAIDKSNARSVPAQSAVFLVVAGAVGFQRTYRLPLSVGSFVTAGAGTGLRRLFTLTSEPVAFAVSFSDLIFSRTYSLAGVAGQFSLAGAPAGMLYSNAPVYGVIPLSRRCVVHPSRVASRSQGRPANVQTRFR